MPVERKVTAETLTVGVSVLGQPLAEPWRRLAAILVDLAAIALLSFLTRPWLALGTGVLLVVLLGNSGTAPLVLRTFRWIFRGLGGAFILIALLALGHSSFLRSAKLDLNALTGKSQSHAMGQEVRVPPNATPSELRVAAARLEEQVEALKAENKDYTTAGTPWVYKARAFTKALGVTFGWSGIYFTLLAGSFGGRTVGKLLFGTRAVKINGSALSYFDAFIRNGGYVAGVAMGMIGFLKLLWEPNRQAVEDRIASTVVIKV
ncbi:MAG: RDD family protein [Opitutaceae bacterium]